MTSLKFLYPRRAEFNYACRQNGLMPSVVMTILADGVIGGVFDIETLKASQKLILDDRRERATKRLMENRYGGGGKMDVETRRKMSKARKGEKSWLWKGGITPINKLIRNGLEFRLWREAVFAKDDYTCRKCGIRGIKLNAHHVQNFSQYPELRFAIDNGVTLCGNCHIKFHNKYGRGNNDYKHLEDYLQNG